MHLKMVVTVFMHYSFQVQIIGYRTQKWC